MRQRGRGIVAVLTAVLVTYATPARASGRGIEVSAAGCAGLEAKDVERLLLLELDAVAREPGEPLRIELSCEGDELRAVAADPVTDKRLERRVPLLASRVPPSERARVIAVLVSQLFLTSWAELLLEKPRGPSLTPPLPPAGAAAGLASRSIEVAAPTWRIGAGAGADLRAFASPIALGTVRVFASFGGPRAHAGLAIAVERGSVSRDAGPLTVSIADLAVTASYRVLRARSVSLDAGARVGASAIDVHARAASSAVSSDSAGGIVGHGGIEIVPRLGLGAFDLGLALTAGFAFPRATARVPGEDSLPLAGLFAGATVLASYGSEHR